MKQFELRAWQAREIEQHALTPKRAILAEPRLGKTLASILSWQRSPLKDSLLVVAPLAVCPMWVRSLRSEGIAALPLYTEPLIERAFTLGTLARTRWEAIVVNEDVIRHLAPLIQPLGVIIDEAHHMRGIKSARGKALRQLCWQADWVRLLTGTPAPKHYGSLWGQMVALDRDAWGHSFAAYAREFLDLSPIFPGKVDGHRNVKELQRRLNAFATIVRREDVFGPDQYEFQVREIDLPPQAKALYRRLGEDFVLEAEGVSAVHILKRMVRLQQLASGYLVDDDGAIAEVHTAKVDAVLEDLDEILDSDLKAVIFHRFKWEGETYAAAIAKRFPGVPLARIRGKMKIADRDAAVEMFQTSEGAAVVVAQTQAGGLGIDLSEANYVLRASSGFGYDDEKQAQDRAFKPGEPRIVVDYRARGTIDNYIAATLAANKNIDESVMAADFREMAFGRIGTPKRMKITV